MNSETTKYSGRSSRWLIAYVSAFFIAAGVVYEIRIFQFRLHQAAVLKQAALAATQNAWSRSRENWIQEELAERGWTRQQLDFKDREYLKHLETKTLIGVE